jgi:sortase (surface protein transpeptidase)
VSIGPVRAVVGVLGELLVTAGLLVLLYTGYLVYGTAWQAERDQQAASAELERRWAVAPVVPTPAAPDDPRAPTESAPVSAPVAAVPVGQPLTRLHVPRFGRSFTVLEGVGQDVLARGPGHYPGTAHPGEVGNVAIAGHRVGRGAPFDPADELRSCDPLVLETRDAWWVYRVLPLDGRGACAGTDPVGLVGRQVVAPSDRSVIAAVPGEPGAAPRARLLTLTTCHPRFSARERLIVHAQLVREQPRAQGRPVELGE